MPVLRRFLHGRKLLPVVLLLVLLYCVRQVVKERTIMTGLADLSKVVQRQLVTISTVQMNHSLAKEVASKNHTKTVNLCPVMPPNLAFPDMIRANVTGADTEYHQLYHELAREFMDILLFLYNDVVVLEFTHLNQQYKVSKTRTRTDLAHMHTTKPAVVNFIVSTVGALAVSMEPISFEKIKRHNPQIKPGGRFHPLDCKSRHRVAIIIPYRDREQHLKILLNHLHPILERQQLDYGIYVIEMAMPTTFNRATLMNIGYTEALKDYGYQCFIFQDVDHVPENDKNLYNCHNSPSHLAVSVDKNNYKLPYSSAFGGVVSLTKEQMIKVNGWSNLYFGWGSEDDDLYRRIHLHGMKVSRGPAEIGRYKMVKHKRDPTNQENKDRGNLLKGAKTRMSKDGLNSLKYELLKRELRPLYAYIYVRISVQGDTKVTIALFLVEPLFSTTAMGVRFIIAYFRSRVTSDGTLLNTD